MDETHLNQFREVTPTGTFTLQNSGWVLIQLSESPTVPPHPHARQG
jgi:hypothetical protein